MAKNMLLFLFPTKTHTPKTCLYAATSMEKLKRHSLFTVMIKKKKKRACSLAQNRGGH